MSEVRKRGVAPTSDGLNLLRKAMAEKVWDAVRVASEVVAAGLCDSMDERTIKRFLQQDATNKKVDKLKAQAICRVLGLTYSDVVDVGVEGAVGQIRTDKPNPFTYGGKPVSADRFYGRKEVLKFVSDRLRKGTSVNLVGLRRSGKTSLLRYLMDDRFKASLDEAEKTIFVFLDLSTAAFATPVDLIEGLRRGIGKKIGKEPWRNEENGDAWAVQEGLEDVRDRGWRVMVLMDEFEAIERKLDLFQDWACDWRSKASTGGLFTMVVASQRSLVEFYQSHNRTSPFDNIFNQFVLGAMEEPEWQGLIREQWQVSLEELGWVDGLAGGLPYYVQLAASALWDADMDREQARDWFRQEAVGRFVRLWRDLEEGERGVLRSLEAGGAIGDRLLRYGLVRSDGRLFSSAFGDWIKENGGAI
jgi:hypothetical protein